ncbi:hypothetical protein [Janthinobacterium svalbardensis]|uniref:hypothetical protein n=1 Tax=Janthinobacterium svalbardensis TaxID=368607 RepID=UPI002FCDB6AC
MASAPPLRIWLYSALLVMGVMVPLALQRWSPWRGPDHAIADHTRQFLATPLSDGKVRVLGLGSSLLWAATPPVLTQVAMPGIDWMRMTKPGAGIGYLEPSLEIIEHNPPDVLIIEANLLLPDQNDTTMDELRQDFMLATKTMIYRIIGNAGLVVPPQAYVALVDQREPAQCNGTPSYMRRHEALNNAANLQTMFDNTAVNLQLTKQLQRLAQRGVRIVVLELRRSELVEQFIAPQKQEWLSRLRQALPPSHHIYYLTSPTYAQQDLYCDGSHLNAAGARLFAPWWAAQLQQLRDER